MDTLEHHLQKLLLKEERSWARLKCNYFTECHDSRGNRWSIKIIDISYRGLGAVMSTALRRGEVISVADPRTRAVVVWFSEGRVGLRICN